MGGAYNRTWLVRLPLFRTTIDPLPGIEPGATKGQAPAPAVQTRTFLRRVDSMQQQCASGHVRAQVVRVRNARSCRPKPTNRGLCIVYAVQAPRWVHKNQLTHRERISSHTRRFEFWRSSCSRIEHAIQCPPRSTLPETPRGRGDPHSTCPSRPGRALRGRVAALRGRVVPVTQNLTGLSSSLITKSEVFAIAQG